jgi:alkyl hydroperoxide reductase subunit AhpF
MFSTYDVIVVGAGHAGCEAAAAAAPKRVVNLSLTGLVGRVVNPESEFKGVKYTREEGDNAFVGLEISQPKYDTTMVVEVKLRRQGDHWQLTQITNSSELLRGVAQLEKKRLLNR